MCAKVTLVSDVIHVTMEKIVTSPDFKLEYRHISITITVIMMSIGIGKRTLHHIYDRFY